MTIRKSITSLGFVVAVASPLAALADGIWITTNDEPGSRIVAPQPGSNPANALPAFVNPPQVGDLSDDRRFVFLGEESGWQLRPMTYRLQGTGLVHVDDPVGHMERHADNTPPTEQQRQALELSAGA